MVVKNGDKRVVVSDNHDVVQPREEDAVFLQGPVYSKTLEFNHNISAFGISEES